MKIRHVLLGAACFLGHGGCFDGHLEGSKPWDTKAMPESTSYVTTTGSEGSVTDSVSAESAMSSNDFMTGSSSTMNSDATTSGAPPDQNTCVADPDDPTSCTDDNRLAGDGCSTDCRSTEDEYIIFATSEVYSADQLKDTATADDLCQGLAQNEGLLGTYKAWLSNESPEIHAKSGMMNGNVIIEKEWLRRDGKPIAKTSTLFGPPINIQLSNAINVTEEGLELGTEFAWTGTTFLGEASGIDCKGWTEPYADRASAGSLSVTNGSWTEFILFPCHNQLRLYCFRDPL